MTIKILENEEVKEFTIKSWSDVTLEKWMRLLEKEAGTEIEQTQELINMMADIPTKILNKLSLAHVVDIFKKCSDRQAKQSTYLRKIVKINNDEYGFIPDLEEITLGEYADLEQYIKIDVNRNLHKIMAILFRPIIDKDKSYYTIAPYDSATTGIRANKFLQMKAEQVQNALLFFWTFVRELLSNLPWYSLEQSKMTI